MFLELLAPDVVGVQIMVNAVRPVQSPQPALENQPIKAAQNAHDNAAKPL